MKNDSPKPATEKKIVADDKNTDSNHLTDAERPKKRIDYIFDFYQASIPFLVALIWPLTIIMILSIFRDPILKTLQELPSLVSSSSAIEIAGVSFQVDERIAKITDPKLKAALSNISPIALRLLVNVGKGGLNAMSRSFSEEEKNALLELKDKGLIELDMNYKNPNNPDLDVYYRPTELGKRAYDFFMDVLFNQFLVETPEPK